jgi:hypothetical protein
MLAAEWGKKPTFFIRYLKHAWSTVVQETTRLTHLQLPRTHRTKHTVPGEVGKPHLVEQIMEDEKWEQVVWFYQKVISLIKDKGCQH